MNDWSVSNQGVNYFVKLTNAWYPQINKNRQYLHRSHQTCQSPWSWSGRWVVWCIHNRHSSSPPLTAAHTTHRPSETGSLPCLAPVGERETGVRTLPQFNILRKIFSASYWLEVKVLRWVTNSYQCFVLPTCTVPLLSLPRDLSVSTATTSQTGSRHSYRGRSHLGYPRRWQWLFWRPCFLQCPLLDV